MENKTFDKMNKINFFQNKWRVINMAVKLKATQRNDLRRSKTKQLREEGFIPAVVYGKQKDTKSIAVEQIELLKIVREEGRNAIISLEIENDITTDVMLQDYQMHPIKDDVTHVDFYMIDLTEEMDVEVSLRLEGVAQGSRDGGTLQQPLFELQVRAKPNEIPDEITVDVSSLEIGDSITVSDLPKKDEYKILDDPDTTIAVVLAPETEEETEEVGADVSVEPELVGADEEEDEEEA